MNKLRAAALSAGVPPRTMYHWLRDETFRAARRSLFDESLATQRGAGRAAQALLDEVEGSEVTGKEVAAILSKVTGREVHYEGFPPDVLSAQSEDLAVMFKWFDSTGYAADIKSLRRDFPEVNWHTFEEWAGEQEWGVLDQI